MIALQLVETLIAQFAPVIHLPPLLSVAVFLSVIGLAGEQWRGGQRVILADNMAFTCGHSVSMMLKRTELRLRPSGMIRS